MKKLIIYLILSIFSGIFSGNPLIAQDQVNSRAFSEESLENFRSDSDFQYEEEPFEEKKKASKKPNTDLGVVLQILMYGAILLIIGVLVYFVGKTTVSKSSKKIISDQIPELQEKDITEVNFESMIKQTVSQGEYRKAVRLLYLETLKTLTTNGWIDWKQHKTNYDYQLELARTKFNQSFDQLTYNFEYIWYGHLDIDEERYHLVERIFREFQSNVSVKK